MINFAIIGTGWITDSFIQSAHSTNSWKLTTVFSRSADSATAFAQKHNITSTHTTLESLVSDTSIQVVYIASPNSLHYAHAKQCLQAGKHVIVEKPATSTAKELRQLFEIAEANDVFLLEAYRHIQEPNFRVLEKVVKEGKLLGNIYGASLTYASYSSRYNNVLAGETPNIFSLDFSGGSLVDLGVYPISAAIALFGLPVSQSYKPYIIVTGADGGGIITLNYEKFGVSINASKIYTSSAPSEIYGERGTISMNGVTDIERVDFWDAKTKKTEKLGGEKVVLNMEDEAREFGRIIESMDMEAYGRLRVISDGVQKVTEDLRRQNGLVFKVERG
ncbi:oxidoreductase-like protein [Tothia fuscella]|uniref:Oxidoreductase-like protein n=1 Tax=Tothia fuscella TaxID=1048955 RepID=A0A9P4TVW4_9PEZI|nr:oxidoreductase-like protein [Tothia fuscella]